jgi:hypothetical protein
MVIFLHAGRGDGPLDALVTAIGLAFAFAGLGLGFAGLARLALPWGP